MQTTIQDSIIDYLQDALTEYEGCKTYGSDLAYLLTERPNADGTLTYNRQKAAEFLSENSNEFGAIAQEYSQEFGEPISQNDDLYADPESVHVRACIFLANRLCGNCIEDLSPEYWDKEFEITPAFADDMQHALESYRGVSVL